MRPKQEVVVLVQLSVFLLAVRGSRGQNPNGQSVPEPGPANDYGNPYDSSYDYTYDKPEEYECYSCTFHVRQGTAAGLDNCRDPFVKAGIPKVPCPGHCAKIYHKTSDTEYTVTRICLPNCKAVRDEKGYTQCCVGQLCNSSGSVKSSPFSLVLLILSFMTAALAL